jgi:hypothetical protein
LLIIDEAEEERLIEERRRKRAEIVKKYQQEAEPINAATPEVPEPVAERDARANEPIQQESTEDIAAANYDSNQDQVADEDERKHREAILAKVSRHAIAPVPEIGHDLFADDDLFAPADFVPAVSVGSGVGKRSEAEDSVPAVIRTKQHHQTLHDNWDDPDGYYQV